MHWVLFTQSITYSLLPIAVKRSLSGRTRNAGCRLTVEPPRNSRLRAFRGASGPWR